VSSRGPFSVVPRRSRPAHHRPQPNRPTVHIIPRSPIRPIWPRPHRAPLGLLKIGDADATLLRHRPSSLRRTDRYRCKLCYIGPLPASERVLDSTRPRPPRRAYANTPHSTLSFRGLCLALAGSAGCGSSRPSPAGSVANLVPFAVREASLFATPSHLRPLVSSGVVHVPAMEKSLLLAPTTQHAEVVRGYGSPTVTGGSVGDDRPYHIGLLGSAAHRWPGELLAPRQRIELSVARSALLFHLQSKIDAGLIVRIFIGFFRRFATRTSRTSTFTSSDDPKRSQRSGRNALSELGVRAPIAQY